IEGANHPLGKHNLPTQSELTVPMVYAHSRDNRLRVRGIINIESPTLHAFDQDDQEFVQALANLAWVAMMPAEQRMNSQNAEVIADLVIVQHEEKYPVEKSFLLFSSYADVIKHAIENSDEISKSEKEWIVTSYDLRLRELESLQKIFAET